MPGSCAVLGCRNRFIRGGKHFYRFPKNEQFQKLWVQFTRKGHNFEVKKCSAVCEDHFAADRVIAKKKGRLYLIKKTVPTIFFRDTKEGLERITIEFDSENCQYVGQESVNLLRNSVSAYEEKALTHDRRQKLIELKNLCRFCFESQNEKFVALNKLQAYSIDPSEMLALIGVGLQYSEVFSEIVCEQCFQQLVSIDGYRKRCRKAQEEIIAEMQELDEKLQQVRSEKTEDYPWFLADYEDFKEEEPQPMQIEVIEEHLDDNISYDVGEEDGEDFPDEQYDTHVFEGYKVIEEVKHEPKMESMDDIIVTDQSFETGFVIAEEDDEADDDDEYQGMPEPSDKDFYNVTDMDTIIKNPDRNSFALRVYECFFCRLVRLLKPLRNSVINYN